ncbi:hypothetical protein DFP72DRAFT_854086 [Ephemerocybe angulata]|uniref:Uncharacterized protein n=1 Tax=Ephemerocybe angulata TaxID=980116 RepID=A0A8H6HL42_9AGAR|nr:hypothetical protein DFP72DRAFT_854086 [Tulosesus angulatus]
MEPTLGWVPDDWLEDGINYFTSPSFRFNRHVFSRKRGGLRNQRNFIDDCSFFYHSAVAEGLEKEFLRSMLSACFARWHLSGVFHSPDHMRAISVRVMEENRRYTMIFNGPRDQDAEYQLPIARHGPISCSTTTTPSGSVTSVPCGTDGLNGARVHVATCARQAVQAPASPWLLEVSVILREKPKMSFRGLTTSSIAMPHPLYETYSFP